MAAGEMSEVLQHLCRMVFLRDGAGLTDGQLLEDYLRRRDEAALAALVRRHGPMVWGACRRVLGNYHDAEDAFQATFLVLVRKAASLASRELLANWLYGVAHQTALKARATIAKRRTRESQVPQMPEPAVTGQDLGHDLQPLLDQGLGRLPDAYRAVVVLCDLEGKTRKEVARQLGLPEGTVGSRLARARAMLAKRLARHGLAVSGGALAAALAQNVASAGVPTSVVSSMIKAASLLGAGQAVATGVMSAKVAALVEGVMKTMWLSKIQTMTAVLVAMVLTVAAAASLSAGLLDHGTHAAEPNRGPKDEPKGLPAKQAKTDQERIKGTWEIQADETEKAVGVQLIDSMKTCKIVFTEKGIEVTTKDGTQSGNYTLDDKADPKQIDMKFVKLVPTKHAGVFEEQTEDYRGNYILDGDTLKIIWTTAREFPANGRLANLMVFKRKAEEKKGGKTDKP
jgi:RNA polymerase sigma factor (sigma-70 family)